MTDKIQKIETAITPMTLIQSAQSDGVSIEKMQQLFELQMQWESSEARKSFNAAISAFRAECPTIIKTRTAHNSRYAGLAETLQQIRPALSNNGLSHRWSTDQTEKNITVTCTVTHTDGHSESTSLTAAADTSGSKNAIQALGSTVTYLERYTLFAILGLASGDQDDDGNASKQHIDTITDAQTADLTALITEVGANEKQFCAYYGVDAVENLPAAKFKSAVAALEKKRGKK